MQNISELLESVKAAPYADVEVRAPHCGVIAFAEIAEDDPVSGPSGKWLEFPGTVVAVITRERNERRIYAGIKGTVLKLHKELEGQFVEAGTVLAVMRHPLTKEEVSDRFLLAALHVVRAPERAKYYFAPEIEKKLRMPGGVRVSEGMELFTVTKMKRETPMYYSGPEGVIYSVYFKNGGSVGEGDPLIGVCRPDQAEELESAVREIQVEWKKRKA